MSFDYKEELKKLREDVRKGAFEDVDPNDPYGYADRDYEPRYRRSSTRSLYHYGNDQWEPRDFD